MSLTDKTDAEIYRHFIEIVDEKLAALPNHNTRDDPLMSYHCGVADTLVGMKFSLLNRIAALGKDSSEAHEAQAK